MPKKTLKKKSTKWFKHKGESKGKLLTGIIITIIALIILAGATYIVLNRLFRAKDIAKILPQHDVIAILEMNIHERDQQLVKFFDTFQENEILSKEQMILNLNEMFSIDFEKEVAPWIYRKAGAALIKGQTSENAFDTLFFIETRDKDKAMKFMESQGIQPGTLEGTTTLNQEFVVAEDYDGHKIYRYPISYEFEFIFLGDYLVIGSNREVLEYLIDADSVFATKYSRNNRYNRISHNVSYNNLIFGYVDFAALTDLLKEDQSFLAQKGSELANFMPFLKVFEGGAFAGGVKKDELYLQTFVSIDNEYLKGKGLFEFDNKYIAKQHDLLPEDVAGFIGGRELEGQLQSLGEIFGSSGKIQELVFEGILNGAVNTYFTEDIDLKIDIYPLLQKEYLIAMLDNDSLIVMLELSDIENDKARVDTLVNSFMRKGAIFAPRVVEVELEDGTTGEEIQVIPEEMKKTNEEYRGYDITVINVGSKPWGIYYAYVLDSIVITTQKDVLNQIIEIAINEKQGFSDSPKYKMALSKLLGSSDETAYVDLSPYVEVTEKIKPVNAVSWGKNYFKDGIQSTYYFFTK
jgi:hypothetical protein